MVVAVAADTAATVVDVVAVEVGIAAIKETSRLPRADWSPANANNMPLGNYRRR
jgi:hypothetical protein